MDLFPGNGGFVRLRSRTGPKYVHADGDWSGVSLRPLGGTATPLEAVWRVEHMAANQGAAVVYLQFQNAAYGRYLSLSPEPAQPGHFGYRAVQSDRHEPPTNVLNDYPLWWRVQRVHPGQDYVRLRLADSNLDLRANGRYLTRSTGVTVAGNRRHTLTTMMHWTVHHVPETPVPLPLPAAPPQPQQGSESGPPQLFPRIIRHVRATDEGEFDQNHHNWPSFSFYDESLIALRQELGQLQGDWDGLNQDVNAYTLCMRPGSQGRLMPLVTDLPRSLDTVNVIVFRTGSPAAAALVYPQIAALAQ